jgi:outer membrane protein OmpA-like peptidoglycan-associated protein
MRVRGIFLLFILSSMGLVLLYLYIFAQPLHLKRLEAERIANIQKVCMKEYPRNRDSKTLQRNVFEGEEKIQTILEKNPIYFGSSTVSLDKSNGTSQNRIILKKLISVLNNIDEDFILSITTHTDKDGSSQKNLKLSQARADKLKKYIEKRTQIVLITAIGYGEELPLSSKTKKLINRRVEIHLQRIKQ